MISMELVIRDYRPEDWSQAAAVYRSAIDSLRESKGGQHPDGTINAWLSVADAQFRKNLEYSNVTVVSEMNGKIVGLGAIAYRLKHRLIGSAYSSNHYVHADFQHGKGGVSVGSAIRKATIEKARFMGLRKLYGYSTAEAIAFHKKAGAVFYPQFDAYRDDMKAKVHYYEIELRPSVLNRIPIEPLLSELSPFARLRAVLGRLIGI
jgi:hypothetical protein